jgi:hypothetical protein
MSTEELIALRTRLDLAEGSYRESQAEIAKLYREAKVKIDDETIAVIKGMVDAGSSRDEVIAIGIEVGLPRDWIARGLGLTVSRIGQILKNKENLHYFKDGDAPKNPKSVELLIRASEHYEEIVTPISPENVALASEGELRSLCYGKYAVRDVQNWLADHGLKLRDEAA